MHAAPATHDPCSVAAADRSLAAHLPQRRLPWSAPLPGVWNLLERGPSGRCGLQAIRIFDMLASEDELAVAAGLTALTPAVGAEEHAAKVTPPPHAHLSSPPNRPLPHLPNPEP